MKFPEQAGICGVKRTLSIGMRRSSARGVQFVRNDAVIAQRRIDRDGLRRV
jgi:hypothetical protein